MSEELLPLPEPVGCALIEGPQGAEYRMVSSSYEPNYAMYSPHQMLAYGKACADAARSTTPAGPRPQHLSEDQVRTLMGVSVKWAGPDHEDVRFDILETALRAVKVWPVDSSSAAWPVLTQDMVDAACDIDARVEGRELERQSSGRYYSDEQGVSAGAVFRAQWNAAIRAFFAKNADDLAGFVLGEE